MTNFVAGLIVGWMLFSATGRDVAAIVYKHLSSAESQILKRMEQVELPPPTKP